MEVDKKAENRIALYFWFSCFFSIPTGISFLAQFTVRDNLELNGLVASWIVGYQEIIIRIGEFISDLFSIDFFIPWGSVFFLLFVLLVYVANFFASKYFFHLKGVHELEKDSLWGMASTIILFVGFISIVGNDQAGIVFISLFLVVMILEVPACFSRSARTTNLLRSFLNFIMGLFLTVMVCVFVFGVVDQLWTRTWSLIDFWAIVTIVSFLIGREIMFINAKALPAVAVATSGLLLVSFISGI